MNSLIVHCKLLTVNYKVADKNIDDLAGMSMAMVIGSVQSKFNVK